MPTQRHYQKPVSILLMLVVILQAGCRVWVEKPILTDTGIVMPQPGILRVTKRDGAIITLRDFEARKDSIVGFIAVGPRLRAAVARTDVEKIEVRADSIPRGARVAGKVYLGVLFALGIWLAVAGVEYGNAASKSH